jgi:glycosyltransferase involved in cell wall biosynthesis
MLLSVALCTYNGEQFITEQLNSILTQTTPVNEIIICDEGSTDNTLLIIEGFKKSYPGIIQFHVNENKLGVVKNFERCITLCKGDIIFLSDQDDIWRNDKVEKSVDYFMSHNDADAIFSDASLIDDSSKEIGNTMWEVLQFKEAAIKNAHLNIYKHILFHGNVVTGACMAIRKKVVPLVVPFKQIFEMYHDEWIALKLAPQNRIHFYNDTLISYRVHSSQQTKVTRHIERTEANALKRSMIFDEPGVDPVKYYQYWKRRLKTLERFRAEGISIDQSIIDEMIAKRKKGILSYYKSLGVMKRKKVLLHNWIKREENIKFSDFLFA